MAELVQNKSELRHTQGDIAVLIRTNALQVRSFGTQTEESIIRKNTKFGKTIGIQTGWGYPGVMMMNTGIQTEVHIDCQNKGLTLGEFLSKTEDFLDRSDGMERFDDSCDIEHSDDAVGSSKLNDELDDDIDDSISDIDEVDDDINESIDGELEADDIVDDDMDDEVDDDMDDEVNDDMDDDIDDGLDSDFKGTDSINNSMVVRDIAETQKNTVGNIEKIQSPKKRDTAFKQDQIIRQTSVLNKVNAPVSPSGVWHQITHIGREEEVVAMAMESQDQNVKQEEDNQLTFPSDPKNLDSNKAEKFDDYTDLNGNKTSEKGSLEACSSSAETIARNLEMSVVEINEHDYSLSNNIQGHHLSKSVDSEINPKISHKMKRKLEERYFSGTKEFKAEESREKGKEKNRDKEKEENREKEKEDNKEKEKVILENMKKISAVVKLEKLVINQQDLSKVKHCGHRTRSRSGAIVTVSNRGQFKSDYKTKTIFVERNTGLVPVMMPVRKPSMKKKERSTDSQKLSDKKTDFEDKKLESSAHFEFECEKSNDSEAGSRKPQPLLKCPVCTKFVGSRHNLEHHLKKCKKKRIHECPFCDLTFRGSASFYKHKTFHKRYSDFDCNICGRPFASIQFLNQHMLISHNPNPYLCHLCNRKFLTLSGLQKHLQALCSVQGKNEKLINDLEECKDNEDGVKKKAHNTRLSTGVIAQTRYDKFRNLIASTRTHQSVKEDVGNMTREESTEKCTDHSRNILQRGKDYVHESSNNKQNQKSKEKRNEDVTGKADERSVSKKNLSAKSGKKNGKVKCETNKEDLCMKDEKTKAKQGKKRKKEEPFREQTSATAQDHPYTDLSTGGNSAAVGNTRVIDTVLDAPFDKIMDEEGNEYIVVMVDNSYVYVQNPLLQDIDQNLANVQPCKDEADFTGNQNVTEKSLVDPAANQIPANMTAGSNQTVLTEFPFPWTRKNKKKSKKVLFPKRRGPKNNTPEYSLKVSDLIYRNNPVQPSSEQEQATGTVVSILENSRTASTDLDLNSVENIEGQPVLGDIFQIDDIGLVSEVVIPHNTEVIEIIPQGNELKDKKYEIDESLKDIPPSKNPCECRYCGQMFRHRGSRTAHEKRHTTPKELLLNYACTKCGKRCETSSEVNNHYKRVHTSEHMIRSQCHICGKWLAQRNSLQSHMRIHSGYKPAVCHVCGKSFAVNSSLKKHLRSHTGERLVPKYPCDICGKKFGTSYNRKLHRMTHTGELPFPCSLCTRKFRTGFLLNSHIKSHHPLMTEIK